MKKKWIIYIHKSKTTNKCYVGQTCRDLETRCGKNGNQYDKKHHLKFYNAIQKYGWDDFEHYIVDECYSLKEAYELEQFYIDKLDTFKNGYNSTLGGAGSKGKVISKEARERISMALKGKSSWIKYAPKEKLPMYGRHHSEETKAKIGKANRGRKLSLEARKKMSLAKLGKPHKPMGKEGREKLRLSHLGSKNPMYGKHTNNRPDSGIPVLQYDKQGNLLAEYKSYHEAERATKVRNDNIRIAIKRNGTAGGYVWKKKN